MLERLEDAQPGLLDSFELIAATSGAVPVALLLGLGYRPSEILRVLSLELPSILAHVPLLYGGNVGRWVRRWLYRPLSCRFTSAPRLELFRRLFGSAKMCDLHRHVLITAFRVDPNFPLPEEIQSIPEDRGRRRSMGADVHRNSWHPVLFSNLPRDCSGAGPDGSLTLVDAAMRATATPTYCPVYQGHVDGTVFSSNPSQTAIAKVISTFPTSVSMTNTCVLSIGGPPAPQLTLPRSADFGLWQWIPWLMSLLFDSSVEAAHRNTQLLLGPSYYRCTPDMPSHIPLHLRASLAQMKEAADGIALAPILAMVRHQVLDPHIHGRDTVGRSRSHSLSSAPSSRRPSRSATPAEAADTAVVRRRSPYRSKSAVRRMGNGPGGLDDLASVRSGVETTRSHSVGPRGLDRDVDEKEDKDDHGAAMAPRQSHLLRSSLQPPSLSNSSRSRLGRQRQYSKGE